MNDPEQVRDEVRERYATAACGTGSCCDDEPGLFGADLYGEADRDALPLTARSASLGCGNPMAVAELQPGETVLDLGSGGGIDLILSARRVGPAGTVYGLDMTDEMLALAQHNVREAGITNIHLLKGLIENVPLPAESVDVVVSNCVVNLSPEKEKVLREIARVLKPGGRLGISDVVAEDRLSPAERAERGTHGGCVAGALSRGEYVAGLTAAGLGDVTVEFTHQVADGMYAALVRAHKPARSVPRELPLVAATAACC